MFEWNIPTCFDPLTYKLTMSQRPTHSCVIEDFNVLDIIMQVLSRKHFLTIF